MLFLNKCDILGLKLKSGIRLTKYVRSFGERPNDPEVAQKCTCGVFLCLVGVALTGAIADFKSKFSAIHREHSPIPRKFYGFCTSVTVRRKLQETEIQNAQTYHDRTRQQQGASLQQVSSTESPTNHAELSPTVKDMVLREHLRASKLL